MAIKVKKTDLNAPKKRVNKEKAIQELSKMINKSMTRKYLEVYLK
jgi:hypothetical protein